MGKTEKSRIDMPFITSTMSTSMVLLLLGLVLLCVLSARTMSAYVRENLSFSVVVTDDMQESDIMKLKAKLDSQPFVKQSEYISKQQALDDAAAAMGTNPEEFLGYNPFQASIEINLNAAYANSDSIAVVEQLVRRETNISDVIYRKQLIDAVNENIRNISLALLVVALLLTLISFALINNTIRLSIHANRFLIHTMQLVGASWNFIRRPFLLRNLWTGLIAAFATDVLLLIGWRWILGYEPELSRIITGQTIAAVCVSVVLLGVLFTELCALLSINRYLRMKASTLYYI